MRRTCRPGTACTQLHRREKKCPGDRRCRLQTSSLAQSCRPRTECTRVPHRLTMPSCRRTHPGRASWRHQRTRPRKKKDKRRGKIRALPGWKRRGARLRAGAERARRPRPTRGRGCRSAALRASRRRAGRGRSRWRARPSRRSELRMSAQESKRFAGSARHRRRQGFQARRRGTRPSYRLRRVRPQCGQAQHGARPSRRRQGFRTPRRSRAARHLRHLRHLRPRQRRPTKAAWLPSLLRICTKRSRSRHCCPLARQQGGGCRRPDRRRGGCPRRASWNRRARRKRRENKRCQRGFRLPKGQPRPRPPTRTGKRLCREGPR